jgi:WD40-like Beta Propeller Repeat
MKMRRLLATTALGGLIASSTGQIKVFPYPYEVAEYVAGSHSHELRIFPSKGQAVTIALPFRVERATFGPDGKSVYGIIVDSQKDVGRDRPGLSRIEFNPTRATPVPGTSGFIIKSFAISTRQDKLVISGNLEHTDGRRCGVFEILIRDGNFRQVLSSDCQDQWSWDHLSLSPNGEQAIASVSRNITHEFHLELIDLVHGTTKSLGSEFWMGVWSPDGKWIAARESGRRDKLFLLDAVSFSRQRALGGAIVLVPAWSPDSRYLLLWKEYLFRCGIYPDLEPPATLETLDTQTGKRSAIRSSQCQITGGPTGWVSREIAR